MKTICNQCKLKSNKDCGKIVAEKYNGALRYIKVPDNRCKNKED